MKYQQLNGLAEAGCSHLCAQHWAGQFCTCTSRFLSWERQGRSPDASLQGGSLNPAPAVSVGGLSLLTTSLFFKISRVFLIYGLPLGAFHLA